MSNVALGTPVWDTSSNGNGPVAEIVILTIGATDSLYVVATSTDSKTLSLTVVGATLGSLTPTLIGTVDDTATHQQTKYYYLQTPGADTFTVTASVPVATANAYVGVVAVAVNNGALSGILVANSGNNNFQSAPGTGTDAITSGTAQTPTSYPCLVVGFSLTDDVTATPVTGTGFTSAGTGMHWELGADGARLESKRITSGAAQATFTSGTGAGSDHYCTVLAVFQELSASGAQPDSMFFGAGSVQ